MLPLTVHMSGVHKEVAPIPPSFTYFRSSTPTVHYEMVCIMTISHPPTTTVTTTTPLKLVPRTMTQVAIYYSWPPPFLVNVLGSGSVIKYLNVVGHRLIDSYIVLPDS